MAEPSRDDIDALVGPATPHFAYQLRARVRELIQDLPAEHPIRRYGEEKTGQPRTGRLFVVPRRRHRPGAAHQDWLGHRSLIGARVGPTTPSRMKFDGASVLVTGGSRGIGKAIALRFAALGATRVAIGYMRGDQAAEQTATELTELGAEPILVRGNVASQRIADEVAALGALDVLIHAAATGVIRPALETEDKHWDWTLSANARALLSLTRAAATHDARGGVDPRDLQPRLLPGACWTTTRSSARPRRRSRRSSATSPSSSPRAGSASTRFPRASSRTGARALSEQGGDAGDGETQPGGAHRYARGRRRLRHISLLT